MKLFEDYLIDGKPILAPDADVDLSSADLDDADSGRDESGFMHRIVVRHRVCTWGFSYAQLTAEEYRYIRSLLEGKAEFSFTYRNPEGVLVETRAYCSNESITYHNARLGLYKNLKIQIIEC